MPVVDKHDDGRSAIDAGCLEYSRSAGVAENRIMTFLLGAAKALHVSLDRQVWNFARLECERDQTAHGAAAGKHNMTLELLRCCANGCFDLRAARIPASPDEIYGPVAPLPQDRSDEHARGDRAQDGLADRGRQKGAIERPAHDE